MGSILDQARAIRASMDNVAADIPDNVAAENKYLFALWSPDSASYASGARVRYGDQLYKCLTTHTSQIGWTPADAPGLWVRIDDPAIEWPAWVQPVGSTDAYPAGAKVTHNGRRWTSDVDANVWAPGVSGWTEVT